MSRILHLISSPRAGASNSNKLADAIIDKLREKDPSASVKVKDLVSDPFPHMEESHLKAFFTPVEQYTDENTLAVQHSNDAIREIMDADVLVIGAPMYNFTITSTLKAWIDHIVRPGITFKYTPEGVQGLVSGKKVYIAMASGGVYSGEAEKQDYVSSYLKTILGFIGMNDITIYRVEGLQVTSLKDHALDKAIDSITID